MTDKELKKHLNSINAEINPLSKQKALQKSLACAERSFRPIGIKDFILNQLHYIKPVQPALCLVFMILMPVLGALCNNLQLIFFISLSLPLLSCITVPEILKQIDSGIMELESSTLYKAGSVFSARLIIYGIISLSAILISAAVTAPFSGSFLWLLLFEILLFTASAFLSLLISLLIRNQYAPAAAIALNIILAASFNSVLNDSFNAVNFKDNISLSSIISLGTLAAATAAAVLMLAIFLFIIFKNYKFNGEKLWKLS